MTFARVINWVNSLSNYVGGEVTFDDMDVDQLIDKASYTRFEIFGVSIMLTN